MRKMNLLAGIVATSIGLGAVSTGSAFAMGCLSPELQTPPVSMANNQMGDSSTAGASSQGFGYDRDAYLAALAKGNSCGTSQQSQPVSGSRTVHRRGAQTPYYNQ